MPVPTSDNGWIALATKSELVEDFEIAAVSTDGAELVELPTNEASETSEADDLGARVSPDGRHVAFLSTREYEGDGSGSWDLYVMASDGSGERRLTSHGQVADLRWTPDGEWITYGVIDASGAATGEFRHMILAIRPDGTDDHERLQLTGFVAGYDWSPDGDRIAYAVCTVVQEPACDIWVANADGSDPEQVTPDRNGCRSVLVAERRAARLHFDARRERRLLLRRLQRLQWRALRHALRWDGTASADPQPGH